MAFKLIIYSFVNWQHVIVAVRDPYNPLSSSGALSITIRSDSLTCVRGRDTAERLAYVGAESGRRGDKKQGGGRGGDLCKAHEVRWEKRARTDRTDSFGRPVRRRAANRADKTLLCVWNPIFRYALGMGAFVSCYPIIFSPLNRKTSLLACHRPNCKGDWWPCPNARGRLSA